MPNIKSAKKRVKVNEAKSLQNRMLKSALKTTLKKFDAVCAAGPKSEAEAALRSATKSVDMAVAKGILHKNTAARRKSGMANKVNSLAN